MQKVCIALPPEAAGGFLSTGLYLAEAILHLDADLTLVVPAETAALLQRPLRPGDVEVESRLCTSEYVAETMRQALAAGADGILLAYWPPRLLALVLQAPALAEAVRAGVQVLATVDGAWWSEGVDAELAHADTYRALEDRGVRFLGISQATLAKSPVRIHGVLRQGGLFPDWTARVARYRRRWPRPLRAAIYRTLVWWGRPVWEKGLQAVVRIAEDAGLQPAHATARAGARRGRDLLPLPAVPRKHHAAGSAGRRRAGDHARHWRAGGVRSPRQRTGGGMGNRSGRSRTSHPLGGT